MTTNTEMNSATARTGSHLDTEALFRRIIKDRVRIFSAEGKYDCIPDDRFSVNLKPKYLHLLSDAFSAFLWLSGVCLILFVNWALAGVVSNSLGMLSRSQLKRFPCMC